MLKKFFWRLPGMFAFLCKEFLGALGVAPLSGPRAHRIDELE
jgi:hypothetical protein